MNQTKKTNTLKTIIFTLLFFLVLICIWEFIVVKFSIPRRILARPSEIGVYMFREFFSPHSSTYVSLIDKVLDSFGDALLGFFISIILGSLIGILTARFKILNQAISPLLFIIQLLPTPAFAPIIASIFGYDITTKIIIIVLFTIFPVVVVVRDAIINIPHNYHQLFKTYHAQEKYKIQKLVIPAIIPEILTTMKILCTASFVASIISELPLSVSKGIGKDIYTSFNNQVINRVWTSLFLVSIVSLIFFYLISKFEKVILTKFNYGHFEE